MSDNIEVLVSECLNNNLIKHYFTKKKNMTYDEEDWRIKNFSRMIGYCILFKETDGIEEYMFLSDEKEQKEFLKHRIADKLGISHDEIAYRMKDIYNYISENFVKKGYVFHAGNSKAIEKNMKYGLSPSNPSDEEKKELMYIASIYNKYGDVNPLGWGILDIENGNNGWFYDSNPSNTFYYADSPEWFKQFCGGNHCYAYGLVPEESRHGYENRDYDACLLAITRLIEKYNMTETDRKKILDFFNKCWNIFSDTEPYLLFVPVSSFMSEEELDLIPEFYFEHEYGEEFVFDDIIEGGCSMFGGINACCYETVGPEVLSCVNLSSILPRYKMSEFAKQKEMTLQDCMRKLNGLDMSLLLKAQEMLEGLLVASNERGL